MRAGGEKPAATRFDVRWIRLILTVLSGFSMTFFKYGRFLSISFSKSRSPGLGWQLHRRVCSRRFVYGIAAGLMHPQKGMSSSKSSSKSMGIISLARFKNTPKDSHKFFTIRL